jgi:predicted TIM-barrel fold metal-dependent hydrolase
MAEQRVMTGLRQRDRHFRVIDAHHHVGWVHGGLGLGAERGTVTEASELETRLATMDRHGIDQAIIITGHGYLRPEGLADTRRVNDGIAAYRDANPTRFPAAVGVVEPLYGPAGLDELDRVQRELGLAGVSFHTRFQGVTTDSPLVRKMIARMADLGLVPFVHALAEIADEALWRVANVARDFPDVPILVLDAFSSIEQCQQVLLIAEIAPNLIFDTALAYTVDLITPLVKRHGADRVVFGTDLYSQPLGYKHNFLLPQLLDSDLSDSELGQILSGNLVRLLHLDQGG